MKILSQLKQATKSDFVKVSFWSGISTVVKMLTGIISIKVVSQVIGPSGIAMVGQFLNSITIISTVATAGIGQGVTKYVAENFDDPKQQQRIIAHAGRITLVATLLLSMFVIFFSKSFSTYIFKDSTYQNLIILFGLSLILFSSNTLLLSILNGYKAYKKFVIVNIVVSLFALALSIFLVLEFGLYGALLNCIASQSVVILVTLIFLHKESWLKYIFSSVSIDWEIVKKMGGFTLMTLTSALLTPFSQMAIRSNIVSALSFHDAGIWEGMNRLSSMLLLVITTSIGIYYLPRLSEIKTDSGLRNEIIKTAKILLPPLALFCIIIYLSRDIIIGLLFSSEFSPMRNLFGMQMVGNFFKIASFLIAYLFWAKGMTKAYILTEVLFAGSFILLAKFGLTVLGVQGVVYAYALNYLLYFILLLIFFRKLLFSGKVRHA